jgi:23S rRNA pseudouridine1911/1915/1917 synthase
MASLNHPVAGDRLYGAKPSPWNRYFLHAHKLVFRSPAAGKDITVESPLPADLVQWKSSLT